MKNLLIFCTLLLSFISCDNQPKSLLWEISGNGLMESSYLFGTWHGDECFRNISFLDTIPGFYQAFDNSEQFVGETASYGDNVNRELTNKTMESFWMPRDTTYADLLDKNQLEKLDSFLMKKIQTTSSTVNIRPNVMSINLTQILLTQSIQERIEKQIKQLEENSDLSDSLRTIKIEQLRAEIDVMDSNLQKKAFEQGKEIFGLDDLVKFNPGYLYNSSRSLKEDADSLVALVGMLDTLNINEVINANAGGMHNAYKRHDIFRVYDEKMKQLAVMSKQSESQMNVDEFNNIFLFARNEKWMRHIERLIREKSTFIAVGAVHLGGEKGLIKLLRKAGYTVEPFT